MKTIPHIYPFFYFHSTEIMHRAKNYSSRKFKLYYSVKACWFKGLGQVLSPVVDGFSVSSLKELQDTREETHKPIHFISPMLREDEINAINQLADSVSFNSLEQFRRLKCKVASHIKIFLRVNPELSLISDKRYDPCRPHSKLGILIDDVKKYFQSTNDHSVTGLHFHNACLDDNMENAIKTLEKIKATLGELFFKFQSINFGGGYVFSPKNFEILQKLSSSSESQCIIEPGFDLVNSAGFLVSSVVDLFKRHGKVIAVLDTSTNHLPEVFEYEIAPEVFYGKPDKNGSYILAGASCLAGDVFGEYHFDVPLQTGQVVIFKNVGAYSLVKAYKFNGLQIPKVKLGSANIEDLFGKTIKNSRITQNTVDYVTPGL